MKCWKCSQSLDDVPKILFRTVCPRCDIDLHVCRNCRYYAVGKPNDCAVPGTEYIRDREAYNFCEEFRLADKTDPLSQKKRFGSLFKDEE